MGCKLRPLPIDPSPRDSLTGAWTILFPVTYCLHIAEEYWAGESFYGWVSRLWSISFTRQEFLALNFIAMIVMIGAAIVVNVTPVRWPLAMFGFITALNGTLHIVASLATGSYSPGAVSGLLVWIPLGVYTLRRCHGALTPIELYGGIAAGAFAHALISAAAFNS